MSVPARIFWFLALLGVMAAPARAEADAPWAQPFSSDTPAILRAAQAVKPSGDARVVVLLDETEYRFDQAGRLHYRFRRVFRPLTTQAAQDWGRFETSYDPWHEKQPRLRVRVISPDGQVHQLDPKTVEVASGRPASEHVYSDRRTVRAPLPAMAPGVVVEEELDTDETRPFFLPGGRFEYLLGNWGTPTEESVLVVDCPASLPFHVALRDLPGIKPQIERRGGRVRYTVHTMHLPANKDPEKALPSDVPCAGYVTFSTVRSWNAVARKYRQIVDRQIAAGPLANIPDFRKGSRDVKVIAGRALAYLHAHVRYTGLEMSESSIVPWTPADTWRRQYGDCKDQATLMVALLRHADIRARVALVDAGGGQDLDGDMPGLRGFDHAIVVIPGRKPLWIDPTNEFARVGEIPSGDQGRWALVVSDRTQRLVRTPVATSRDNFAVEERDVTLAERGPATVVETTTYHGGFERHMRDAYRDAKPDDLRKSLTRYIKDTYRAKKLVSFHNSDPSDLSQPFRMEVVADQASRGYTDMFGAEVYVLPAGLTGWLPDNLKQAPNDDAAPRDHDVALAFPYAYEWRYHIVAPPGFRVRGVPEDRTVPMGPATLTETFHTKDAQVEASFRFEINKRRLTSAEARAIGKAVDKFRGAEGVAITFDQIGMADVEAGKIREGLAELRKLAALHPREALHHAQLAYALYHAGLGEAARVEGRRAVALEPGSAFAHYILGCTLEYDLMGREWKPGFDWDGALDELRKAHQLAPDDHMFQAELAILLEHDAQGNHWPAGHLDPAIKEHRELFDAGDKRYQVNLFLSMLFAGHLDDLAALLDDQPSTEVNKTWIVAVEAARHGTAAALAKARALTSGTQLQNELVAAGQLLVKGRYYPEAAGIFRAIALGAKNGSVLRLRAETLDQIKRHETLHFSDGKPADVVRRFWFLRLEETPSADRLSRALIAPVALNAKPGVWDPAALRAGFYKGFAQLDMPRDAVIDLTAMEMDFSADEAGSYAVRLVPRNPLVPPAQRTSFYLARHHGRWRIVSMDDDPALLGAEALELADEGHLDGARQWLDWARESAPTPPADAPLVEPFARAWTRGEPGSADKIRTASAMLLAHGGVLRQAAPILQQCAGLDDHDLCDFALASGLAQAHRWGEAVAIEVRFAKAYPDNVPLGRMRFSTYLGLGDFDEAQGVLDLLEKGYPGKPDFTRMRGVLLAARNKLSEAQSLYETLANGPEVQPEELNQAAWLALFTGTSLDKAIDEARRAAAITQRNDVAVLNTLATLLAAHGDLTDAYQVLVECMEKQATADPMAHDWLAFGRIAQGYGYDDIAREAYRRAEKLDPNNSPVRTISVAALARRWLAGLK